MQNNWETLEHFFTIDDTNILKNLVTRYVENFPSVRYLILCGDRGTGKSHLARYLSRKLSENHRVAYFKNFPGEIPTDADLYIFENVNFYDDDEKSKLLQFIERNREKNFVITSRGNCESPLVERLKSLLGESGNYFYLSPPPYELKRAIIEEYLNFNGIELNSHIIDLLIDKLDWPAPLRFIDMVKTRSVLLNEDMDDEALLSLIRNFIGGGN